MNSNYSNLTFLIKRESVKLYVITFLACINLTAFGQSTIYVDSTLGDDTTGDGTSGTPYQSFHKGYTMSSLGDILDLTGTFTWTDSNEVGDVVYEGYTIAKNLTIQGQGPGNTIVQASTTPNSADRRVFKIANNIVVIFKDLMIRHGSSFSGYLPDPPFPFVTINGGAIGSDYGASQGVNLSLENVIISNNFSTISGVPSGSTTGVYCEGSFSAVNCTFQNNTQIGASTAIALELYQGNVGTHETRNIINCTFYNNTSTNTNAFAVNIDRKGANIMNSTFINNTNAVRANALFDTSQELYITNCILGNSNGYDLYAINGGDNGVKCNNSIIEVENVGSKIITYNSCLTGNQANLNTITPTTNNGNNLITPFIELATNSVAVNAGITGNFGTTYSGGSIAVPLTDQIGATRSGNVDMGSYEFGGVVLSVKKNVIGNVKLFPTISNGLIHVSDNKTYQLYVYDVLGQIIKSGIIRGEIDISNHPKGLYFVKLRSDNFEHTFKVLLN